MTLFFTLYAITPVVNPADLVAEVFLQIKTTLFFEQ